MISLLDVFSSRAFAGVPASPLQRAICLATDGLPVPDDLAVSLPLERYFGAAQIEALLPAVVVLVCGVRAGKSFLTSCAALRCVLRADLSALKSHEIPRAVIVAPTTDNAEATFRILLGILEGSPALSRMLEGPPTSDRLTLRRPDGRRVEVVVVAAHRGGIALRSRWLVFAALEEVALFGAETQGNAVNAEEQLRAAETRLVPGGQVWLPSSPWGPSGLLFDLWRDHFGSPGRVLVVHAPTLAMNPSFGVERVEAIRRRSPDVAAREYDAQWLDADSAMFSSTLIDEATRSTPLDLPPDARRYIATTDAATRGNSWTLVIGHREGSRIVIDLARQWTGSRTSPLSPERTWREIGALCRPYGVRLVHSDSWGIDSFRDFARPLGLSIAECSSSQAETLERYFAVRTRVESGALELPPQPHLVQDLKLVRRKALANGERVHLPTTPDGRHCDFAPAVALLVAKAQASAPFRFNSERSEALASAIRAARVARGGPDWSSWGSIDAELREAPDPIPLGGTTVARSQRKW